MVLEMYQRFEIVENQVLDKNGRSKVAYDFHSRFYMIKHESSILMLFPTVI